VVRELRLGCVWGLRCAPREAPYEVWAVDQSGTVADGGGTLYVYDGPQLAGRAAAAATPEKIDLGGVGAQPLSDPDRLGSGAAAHARVLGPQPRAKGGTPHLHLQT